MASGEQARCPPWLSRERKAGTSRGRSSRWSRSGGSSTVLGNCRSRSWSALLSLSLARVTATHWGVTRPARVSWSREPRLRSVGASSESTCRITTLSASPRSSVRTESQPVRVARRVLGVEPARTGRPAGDAAVRRAGRPACPPLARPRRRATRRTGRPARPPGRRAARAGPSPPGWAAASAWGGRWTVPRGCAVVQGDVGDDCRRPVPAADLPAVHPGRLSRGQLDDDGAPTGRAQRLRGLGQQGRLVGRAERGPGVVVEHHHVAVESQHDAVRAAAGAEVLLEQLQL